MVVKMSNYVMLLSTMYESVKQNSKVVYVINRVSELYDHLWLLLANQMRDHVTERLQLKTTVDNLVHNAVNIVVNDVVNTVVPGAVKSEIEKQKQE